MIEMERCIVGEGHSIPSNDIVSQEDVVGKVTPGQHAGSYLGSVGDCGTTSLFGYFCPTLFTKFLAAPTNTLPFYSVSHRGCKPEILSLPQNEFASVVIS